jgi:NitT/TauT family transport system substrate-binding protein
MRRWLIALAAALAAVASPAAEAQTVVMVGWCASNLTSAAAPLAVAQKMGWFDAAGFRVEPYPLPGSEDCVKAVAAGTLPYALASIEPLAIMGPKDAGLEVFYTAYQGNIYGLAVPEDSPIHSVADLKGKRIGVASMASGGVIVARALVASAGLDPDRDIHFVATGEGAQAAAAVANGSVDALSLYDVQYALVGNDGEKLRMLDNSAVSRFPSNGFVATRSTIEGRRAEAVALARGYAMGTVFTIANPRAAIGIMHALWPQTVPDGMSEATALRADMVTLQARIPNWTLQAAGVTNWGESSAANYDAYMAFLVKSGVLKQAVPAADLVTNDLIPAINDFDAARVTAEAKAYQPPK